MMTDRGHRGWGEVYRRSPEKVRIEYSTEKGRLFGRLRWYQSYFETEEGYGRPGSEGTADGEGVERRGTRDSQMKGDRYDR